MTVTELRIPGCLLIVPDHSEDERGTFVKTYHEPTWQSLGLRTDWVEEYYSISHQGVLRGLHCQLPPSDHVKVVSCLSGRAFDVVVELRKGSPLYGKTISLVLDAAQPSLVYIPAGLAHGFYTMSPEATVAYRVTSVYDPEHDAGILWSSVDIAWPAASPIVSARDAALPPLSQFKSAFVYRQEAS
ncbi:dTDP-4-dehydrorhamnose 3,5-epimerase [Candidatus Cryosericum septentrionale]|uniref:dTDP-4-dehydrorhamnose 3,5-epimerase n=1 Tax=Candidatus Cryosericum septentrionale TaxID=2290913 RepID=UPI001A9EA325|nr:dTDP-4-dehydrorhamnose 3,5-epimerase [Candidatus Cryosericum septentrionale]